MAKQNEENGSPLNERKKKLEIRMLQDTFFNDCKAVEDFLNDNVPAPLMAQIREVVKELTDKIQQFKNRGEVKNLEWLQQKLATTKRFQYLTLVQLLYKFPSKIQISLESVINYLKTSPDFENLTKHISPDKYIKNSWSFKRFLTDCIALVRLRKSQLDALERI